MKFSKISNSKAIKRSLLCIIAVAIFLSATITSCKKDEEKGVMSITAVEVGYTSFSLKGYGTATVDWGDGSPNLTESIDSETYTSFSYIYPAKDTRTIRIYGDKVTALYCDGWYIYELDLSKNTALTELDLSRCYLLDLDVSKNTELKILRCWGPQITSLDVSKNLALTKLWCVENQLTSLDVSNNLALADLTIVKNPLRSLDVSKNTALTVLDLSIAYLTSLDVSNNTALTILACNYNGLLTKLDVSKNTALQRLFCCCSKITSLDLSNNTVLSYLTCTDNQFSAEALDALFDSLHSNTIPGSAKNIYVQDNPGSEICNPSIASEKGWIVETRPGSPVH